MKKILSITLVLLLACSLFAAGAKEQATSKTIVVGATPEPHAAFLNLIVEDLAAAGYTLKVQEFTDYVTPNKHWRAGTDANFFQHIPYLESFKQREGISSGQCRRSTSSVRSLEEVKALADLPNVPPLQSQRPATREGHCCCCRAPVCSPSSAMPVIEQPARCFSQSEEFQVP